MTRKPLFWIAAVAYLLCVVAFFALVLSVPGGGEPGCCSGLSRDLRDQEKR